MAHLAWPMGFLFIASIATVTASTVHDPLLSRDTAKAIPAYPFDIDTAPYCVWWFDSDGSSTCEDVMAFTGVSMQDFVFWNPSLNAESCKIDGDQSYCVAALDKHHGPWGGPGGGRDEQGPETVTVTVVSTDLQTTPEPVPVTVTTVSTRVQTINVEPVTVTVISTIAANPNPPVTITMTATTAIQAATGAPVTVTTISTSITTLPGKVTSITHTLAYTITSAAYTTTTTTLPGQVTFISVPVTVTQVRTQPITQVQTVTQTMTQTRTFVATSTKSVLAVSTTTVTIVRTTTLPPSTCLPPSPTKPSGNGITTPVPIQDGMITNCRSFYFVQPGDTCAIIASRFGISLDRFVSWNPGAKRDCTSLWAGTYACVAVL